MPVVPGIGVQGGQVGREPPYQYRGHGHHAGGAGNVSFNYASVVGGVAPREGDLVMWNCLFSNAMPAKFVDLSGLAYHQYYATVSGSSIYHSAIYVKKVTAADLASPPVCYGSPQNFYCGWLALTLEGPLKTISFQNWLSSYVATTTPTHTQNMAADGAGPNVATCARMNQIGATMAVAPGPGYQSHIEDYPSNYDSTITWVFAEKNPVSQTFSFTGSGITGAASIRIPFS